MDEQLHQVIHRAKNGDKEAYAEIVKQFKDPVYRYALGMVNDRMDAEDISQEAFVKAYFALPNLGSEYAFASWLFRIVSNLCKDRIKKLGKERGFHEETDNEMIDRKASESFERISMEEALARLSMEHREVILLHDVHGYRYEEIAHMTDIPLGTVKSRLFAARMALRKELRKGDL